MSCGDINALSTGKQLLTAWRRQLFTSRHGITSQETEILSTPLGEHEVWRYLLNFIVESMSFLLRFRKVQGFNLGKKSGSPDW